MNKPLTLLFLGLFLALQLQSQNGYIKFIKEFSISKPNIKCLRGEILPCIKYSKGAKIHIVFNNDTIKNLKITSKDFSFLDRPIKNFNIYRDSIVKSKDKTLILFNCSLVPRTDTINLVSENSVRLMQWMGGKDTTIQMSTCGSFFRLVISNSPSIFYETAKLIEYIEPEKDTDGDGIIDKNDSCPDVAGVIQNHGCPEKQESSFFKTLAWWHYVVVLLVLILLAYVAWRLIIKRFRIKNKVPIKKIYYSGHLKDFAEANGIILKQLIKLNRDVIPRNYNSLSDNDRKNVQKQIKSKGYLITGFSDASGEELQDNFNSETIQPDPIFSKKIEDNFESSRISNQSDRKTEFEIIQRLSQIEQNIIREIRVSSSKSNDYTQELNRLNSEIANLKSEVSKGKVEKDRLDSTLSQLKNDNSNLQSEKKLLVDEKNQLNSDLNLIQDKIIPVDFLSSYCDTVLSYLVFCNDIVADAYGFLNRIDKRNPQQNISAYLLLLKFQTTINKIPIGNWMQILKDINETGVTNSKQIRSSFKQIDNIDDKKKQFQRLLFSEVLIKYSSSILIVAEEFRNLEHFHVPGEIANEARSIFEKHVTNLISKVKPTGLENKYVPLFRNFEEYLGLVMSVDSERSNAYKVVTGLEKGAIAEIVSYGVKTMFEETKTLIIPV